MQQITVLIIKGDNFVYTILSLLLIGCIYYVEMFKKTGSTIGGFQLKS